MNKFVLFLLSIILSTNIICSQELSKKQEREMLEDAEYYYEEENYPKALEIFEKLAAANPNDVYYRLMVGILYTYRYDKKKEAISYLEDVKKQNPDFNEVNFYLGKAYMVNHLFDNAIEYFTEYMKNETVADEDKVKARRNILYCENAKKFTKDSVNVRIENIGPPVNTDAAEYVPLITPDESVLIFTYRGPKSLGGKMDKSGKPDPEGDYYEDIMISYKFNDQWLEPEPIGENINTKGHDASIALSVDGQKLFIYKSTKKDHGDIYISYLKGNEWSKPVKIKGDVNTDEFWEGSASMNKSENILYFSSDREGGFGGRDLWVAEKQEDGTWGNIQNLGPTINTRYNEDAPFIHPDDKTLYFSSEGHESMGGYDIFYTTKDENGDFTEPVNVGYPINTIGDDRYFVLSASGKTGYYSTAGKSKNGQHDIFTVKGEFGTKPILALVIGVVNANDKPVEADISITNITTGQSEGTFKSNAATGKYMLALTPGNKYKIAIEVDGYDPKIEYLNVEDLETYVQVEHNFNLYSEDYKKNNTIAEVGEPEEKLQEKLDVQIEKYKKESTLEGYMEMVYNKILKEYGDVEEEGVEYFIDLGDEKISGKIDSLKAAGVQFRTQPQPDGTSKVVMGPFKTLAEAETYKRLLARVSNEIAQKDITIIDNGKEMTVQDKYKDIYDLAIMRSQLTVHDELVNKEEIKQQKTDNAEYVDNAGFTLDNDSLVTLKENGLTQANEKIIKGVTFKVEIAATTDTTDAQLQEYLSKMSKYGKINKKTFPDGVTRYSFGPFETLVDAENFRANLIKQEKASQDAFVTVFVFGKRKTVEEYAKSPCENDELVDFSWFVGKDLNDTAVYNKLLRMGGSKCAEGLTFKVQIAAYRHPENYKYDHLIQFGQPVITPYPDGITRFTQGEFNTMGEAELLRQKIIKAGQEDAWITPFYNGKRMLMEDLIKVNFYGKKIN
jgi:hypothetical protein